MVYIIFLFCFEVLVVCKKFNTRDVILLSSEQLHRKQCMLSGQSLVKCPELVRSWRAVIGRIFIPAGD